MISERKMKDRKEVSRPQDCKAKEEGADKQWQETGRLKR